MLNEYILEFALLNALGDPGWVFRCCKMWCELLLKSDLSIMWFIITCYCIHNGNQGWAVGCFLRIYCYVSMGTICIGWWKGSIERQSIFVTNNVMVNKPILTHGGQMVHICMREFLSSMFPNDGLLPIQCQTIDWRNFEWPLTITTLYIWPEIQTILSMKCIWQDAKFQPYFQGLIIKHMTVFSIPLFYITKIFTKLSW